jgi:hypothetical protein
MASLFAPVAATGRAGGARCKRQLNAGVCHLHVSSLLVSTCLFANAAGKLYTPRQKHSRVSAVARCL